MSCLTSKAAVMTLLSNMQTAQRPGRETAHYRRSFATCLVIYISFLTLPELEIDKSLHVWGELTHTHTHTHSHTHTQGRSVFLSEGQLCQGSLVSVPSSVIRWRFQGVRFRKICVIPKLRLQRQPGATGGTAAQCRSLTSQPLLPAAQWPGPGASAAPVWTAKVTPRAGRGLSRRRHVTHLQRLSPEQTCRRTLQPGARWAETYRERAV